jgi:hypothetical protein
MGNELSQEEQDQILEEAYNLEDPKADEYLNSGTAAPNCQPKHTVKREERDRERQKELEAAAAAEGQESTANGADGASNNAAAANKHRRASSSLSERDDQEERRKRQHKDQEMSAAEQKKLSYFQMARLGYQELVNAIIRPPRADYKVSLLQLYRFYVYFFFHIHDTDTSLLNNVVISSHVISFPPLLFRWKRWDLPPLPFVENDSLELILRYGRSVDITWNVRIGNPLNEQLIASLS